MNKVPTNEITRNPTPAAIPEDREKKISTMSCMSFTAVRKRIMDMAPTSPNALAKLFPITMMTRAVIMDSKTKLCTKL
jgi:hypothetical protein